VSQKLLLEGTAKVDQRTKNLIKRLNPNDIAVINHNNLDNVAAQALLRAHPRAIINAGFFSAGYYPNMGPLVLLKSGIVLVDNAGEAVMEEIREGQLVRILDDKIFCDGRLIGRGNLLNEDIIKQKITHARENMNKVMADFIKNTLEYAGKEVGLVTGEYNLPRLGIKIKGRHVLVVVRGENYKEDLEAIRSYINEVKPVLIGVDGGADALVEFGYRPDIIAGDMDSVTDETLLLRGPELIVHAYPDGRAPGLERIRRLGRKAEIFAAPGTSEDIAMLLAYENGAELIVAVGAHFCIEDFLEKGRRGMGSTFLVRTKIGSVLVDAKGVSRLYRSSVGTRHVVQIFLAALLPTGIVFFVSPVTRELFRLLLLHFKLLLGI
jgi:uncharacterized membrane-anchored protein